MGQRLPSLPGPENRRILEGTPLTVLPMASSAAAAALVPEQAERDAAEAVPTPRKSKDAIVAWAEGGGWFVRLRIRLK